MKPFQLIANADFGLIIGHWTSGVATYAEPDPSDDRRWLDQAPSQSARLHLHGEWLVAVHPKGERGETHIFAEEAGGGRGNVGLIPSWSTEWQWLPIVVGRIAYQLGYRVTA